MFSNEVAEPKFYMCAACGDKIPFAVYDHKCWVKDKADSQEDLPSPDKDTVTLSERLVNDDGGDVKKPPRYLDASGNYRDW